MRDYLNEMDTRMPESRSTAQSAQELQNAQARLSDYEKLVELSRDMMTIVDREYRYLVVNRAFASYRGMEPEQVVGRLVRDVLHPDVFESSVKSRLDDCFQGHVVNYELKYTYPGLGERDLSI